MKATLFLALAAVLASPGTALAQFTPQGPSTDATPVQTEARVETADAAWATAPVEEQRVVSRHRVTTPDGTIAYTATAGTLTIASVTGRPTASIFYVAYTADGPASAQRPVTFIYNGGPGASSIWLHMGSFGPVRVATDTPEPVAPAPHDPLGPNPDTLLDKTDLVFIDPVGTGYSRPLGDTPIRQFWSVDGDVDAFARAITGYIAGAGRWTSPKFLMGESYGTTRSAILAQQLQDRGVAVNGVILLSSFLNQGMLQSGYDRDSIGFLPTYAAVGWYHGRVTDRAPDVETAVERAREFADGPYAAALARGSDLPDSERQAIARRVSELTGLSERFVLDANLRVDVTSFQKELLRDQGLSIGRSDARYTSVDASPNGAWPERDASHTAGWPAYNASLQRYLSEDLGYQTRLPYLVAAYAFSDFRWDNSHMGADGTPQPVVNGAADLAFAMRTNPYLKVLSLNGYYDLATPFANTEYDLRHMALGRDRLSNISRRYYPGGHMAYVDPTIRKQMHDDIGVFIDEAVAAASATPAP